MNTPIRCIAFVLVALLICGGCGGSMAQVSGVVKRDGKVVPGGKVLFTPSAEENKPAFGEIQSDGTFTMATEEAGDGVMVGQYRVSVAGKRDAEDASLRTTYLGPRDKLLDVVAGEQNEFDINISEAEGWEAINPGD